VNDWELILTMVGEKATTDITIENDSQGFDECNESAKEGGEVANETRKSIEKRIGRTVMSKNNNLDMKKKKILK